MNSDLANDYRLIAMDMRGHGLSDKPRDAYGESKLWADDVHATMRTLKLDRAILCDWAYGPLVILDYIRHYGEERDGPPWRKRHHYPLFQSCTAIQATSFAVKRFELVTLIT